MTETRDQPDDVPVLVVGAGPAGLAAAIALARHDIPCLLVERRRTLSALPRATVVSTRSMELLRAWGLDEEVRAGGVDVEWLMLECETLALAAAGSALEVGLPSREQSTLVSPAAPECVAQDHLEPVMLRHLRSLPAARVELGTELAGLDAGPHGARAVLRDADTGTTRVVRARYLVAADGAYSAVRRALKIPMRGPDGLLEGMMALFRAPLWELLGDLRYGLYSIKHPGAPGLFLPAGPPDRWLFGIHDEGPEIPGELRVKRLVRLAAGAADLPVKVERVGLFTSAAQLADRFRSGAAFLAGDAAHRVTPRGGTGMNIALHDGYDLGWKLAWVLRGWAGDTLLDSYEAERRPVAEHNAARSADPHGSIRPPAAELRADVGGRIAHVWSPSPAGPVSTLDLLAPGLTLFTAPDGPVWDAAAASVPDAVPITVRRVDPLTARALGIGGGGALLARQDGSPAGLFMPQADAAPTLRAAVAAAVA